MGDELAGIGNRSRGRVAANDVEGDHRSGACHLATHDAVGIASGQTGVVDSVHERVRDKPVRDALGTGLLSVHSHWQRLQPAVQEVATERMKNASGDGPHPTQTRRPFRTCRDDAAQRISVATDELRRTV